MNKNYIIMAILFLSFLFVAQTASAKQSKGIYLTQYTLENTALLNYLIKNSKEAGIDTFVIDLELPSSRYEKNIKLVKDSGIQYVARIIMFPGGGTPAQVENPEVWQKKYKLVKQAMDWGADQIQLDYIRYNTKQRPSQQNAENVFKVIKWYKDKVDERGIPLQIDVFGIASFGESKYIGHNIKTFSETVDAICPMVYPSHYVPFREHFLKPYDTVYRSLKSIQKQFNNEMPIKMYAFIELSNYHYPMSNEKTLEYIQAQINAVHEARADGWYAWSAHNRYDNLFRVLKENKIADTTPLSRAKSKVKKLFSRNREPIPTISAGFHSRIMDSTFIKD